MGGGIGLKHIIRLAARRRKGAILAATFASITVVMLLSSTMLLMVQSATSITDLRTTLSEDRREISAIGDDFVASRLSESYEGYSYSTETVGDNETFILTCKGRAVLKVTVDRTDGDKILLWQTDPENEEETADGGAQESASAAE